MSVYKKTIFLVLIFASFLFCNNKILLADSIAVFKQKDLKTQVGFINSMSKEEKFGFLQKFLPGSCFVAPPITDVKFLSDGRALIYDSRSYFFNRWKIQSNTFKIWKQKPSDSFPEFKKEYVLTNLTAEDGSSYHPALWLRFFNSKNEAYAFQYNPECAVFTDGHPMYERYKKSLKEKWNVFSEQIYWGGRDKSYGAKLINNENLRLNAGRDGYLGVFHFGQSEWKSDLFIIVSDDKIYGQWKRSRLIDNGTRRIWDYTNLDHVTIRNGVLEAKGWSGKFVKYYDGSNWLTGLIILTSPVGMHNEFGEKKEDYGMMVETFFNEYIHGTYKQTYFKNLDAEDIKDLSKKDLKIMRNEIFARYGYKFTLGGSMDQYFRSQNWYEPQYEDISHFLTDIEKENIKFIKQHE